MSTLHGVSIPTLYVEAENITARVWREDGESHPDVPYPVEVVVRGAPVIYTDDMSEEGLLVLDLPAALKLIKKLKKAVKAVEEAGF